MSSIIYNEVFENLVAHKPVSYIYDTPLIERKMNDTLEMMFNLGEDGFSILIEEPSSSEYTKPSFVDIIHLGGAVSHYKVNLMSLKDAFECNAWLLDVSGQKKETHVLSLVGPLIQMHVEQIEDDGYEVDMKLGVIPTDVYACHLSTLAEIANAHDDYFGEYATRIQRAFKLWYKKRYNAAWKIQRTWRHVLSNPSYAQCKNRLLREFDALIEDV